MKAPALVTLAIYRGVYTYLDQKMAFKDFDTDTRAFNTVSKGTEKGIGGNVKIEKEKT